MKRDSSIDFIKGMAIILMVVGHAGPNVWVGKFIYLFHMAVFFMASGYFFSVDKISSGQGLWQFVWKRFCKLWGTYVFWSVAMMLCHNLFIDLNIYTDNPEFLTLGLGGYNHLTPYWHTARKFCGSIFWAFFMMSSPNGAFWFLKALLASALLYAGVSYCVRKITRHEFIVQTIMSILAVVFGAFAPNCQLFHYMGGRVVFTAYALLHLGRVMRLIMPKLSARNICIFALVALALLLPMLRFDRFELAMNRFHSIPVMLLASCCGWFFLAGLSKLFDRVGGGAIVAYIGKRTLPILIFHFLAFKIVSAIGVFALQLPHYCIAAFPIYFKGLFWCLAYVAVGIAVPIGLYEAYARCLKGVSRVGMTKWMVK